MHKKIWILSRALIGDWLPVCSALIRSLTWPDSGEGAMLRFTLGKLRQVNSASGQTDYLGEAAAENLSAKAIPSASFYLYLLDKNGNRVGEGYLEVTQFGGRAENQDSSQRACHGFLCQDGIEATASSLR